RVISTLGTQFSVAPILLVSDSDVPANWRIGLQRFHRQINIANDTTTYRIMNFAKDCGCIISNFPRGIMRLEPGNITDPQDVPTELASTYDRFMDLPLSSSHNEIASSIEQFAYHVHPA